MNPKLSAIAGPLRGQMFALEDDEIFIGRESSNSIQLNDPSVSRRHCVIKRVGKDFKLGDMESLNGTFVNDLPAKDKILSHKDRVKIGDHTFIFLFGDEDISVSSSVKLDDGALKTGTQTVRISLDEAFRLLARDLSVLMKICTRINAIHGLENLQKELIELIFEVVPAKQGAILLKEEAREDFVSVFGLDRNEGVNVTVNVSRTIVQQVLNENVALLSNELMSDEAFEKAESLIASRVSSVLCLPLRLHEKTTGVIYLNASDANVKFDEDHLRLLSAVANVTAVALENAKHFEWLESENERLRDDLKIERNMVGESVAIRKVYNFIAKAAPSDSTVLIRGESGTGKELAARAIHQNSRRVNKPFVAINCAALTETLLESELFGHEKGAFTGAVAQKKGKIEIANEGTLFLDEIGELAPSLQAKLLRVLQEREFERVGGTKTIKADIRLIAATNRDLEADSKTGKFRQDLFYRLNVVGLTMPSLRMRREDIPLLANYFIQKFAAKAGRRIKGLSAAAKNCLISYTWHGNVRELENAIEHAVVLGSTDYILPEDLPESVIESSEGFTESTSQINYHDVVKETKKKLILDAMQQSNGSYVEAAKVLGVHANYLHRLIRNLDLKDELREQGF